MEHGEYLQELKWRLMQEAARRHFEKGLFSETDYINATRNIDAQLGPRGTNNGERETQDRQENLTFIEEP